MKEKVASSIMIRCVYHESYILYRWSTYSFFLRISLLLLKQALKSESFFNEHRQLPCSHLAKHQLDSKSKSRNLATLPFQAVSSVSADSVNAPEFVPRFAVGTCLQLDSIFENIFNTSLFRFQHCLCAIKQRYFITFALFHYCAVC